MRALSIFVLVVVIGVIVLWAIQTKAPDSVPAAKVGDEAATTTASTTTLTVPSNKQATLTSFSFTGYGPGKIETGTFKETSVSGVQFGQNGLPVAGRFTIKTATVSTGKDGLDRHLCTPDFFDCTANPEIVFDLKSIQAGSGANVYSVSGNLTFRGKTQPIQFDATATGSTFAADFKFDTTFFDFKYIGIDRDVRIQFAGEVR
ncbi:MAG TPA: YceI family protein [Candidatus Paceibacterota bacterium]